jgi:methylmalonyl-CoA/ethylmalonyl-CoA epimerase
MHLHHIGIAVKDIEASRSLWERLLNTQFSPIKRVNSQDVLVSFCDVGSCRLELVQAASAQSVRHPMLPHPVLSFIQKRGEGLHHIAFNSDDLRKDIERLQSEGLRPISLQSEAGIDGPVVFLNPEDCGGTLVELCEVTDARRD